MRYLEAFLNVPPKSERARYPFFSIVSDDLVPFTSSATSDCLNTPIHPFSFVAGERIEHGKMCTRSLLLLPAFALEPGGKEFALCL